jgi:hypothetical protein
MIKSNKYLSRDLYLEISKAKRKKKIENYVYSLAKKKNQEKSREI